MAGITQSQDVITAVGTVVTFVQQARQDGWGWSDLGRAMQSDDLRNAVIDAVRGAQQIPGEITDADLGEIFALVDQLGGLFG